MRANPKPRPPSAASTKRARSGAPLRGVPQVTDLHFHGAFGVDLADPAITPARLDQLAFKLKRSGVQAFCPTLLSLPLPALLKQVSLLGQWIHSCREPRLLPSLGNTRGATLSIGDLASPLGIHLEGPFLNPLFRGAHVPGAIQPFFRKQFIQLWDASLGTICLLTLAPEVIAWPDLRWLIRFCRSHNIKIHAGHSAASYEQAVRAFDLGISGITHAWNAMRFHHRDPGLLGAALDSSTVNIEIIPDGVHLHPSTLRMLMQGAPSGRTYWVSDSAPCTGLRRHTPCTFGPLWVAQSKGASYVLGSKKPRQRDLARLTNNSSPLPLAGGGQLLSTLAEGAPMRLGIEKGKVNRACRRNPRKVLLRKP